MDYKDYYKTLNVDKKADEKSIKESYRKLARKFHPDLNPGNKRAEEKFKEINEAYGVLGDANKRSKYDQLGSDWQNWENYAGQPQGGTGGRHSRRSPGEQGSGNSSGFRFDEESFGGGGFSDFFRTFFGSAGVGGEEQFESMERGAQGGADIESTVELDLKDAFLGGERSFQLQAQDECEDCG
ncbi:MAG: DnaJ domain-containing protein, partial [Candidatus Firestonebacteria bacterium]